MEIKISDAKKIAIERGYDIVIVIGIQNDNSGHVTTYGKNQMLCNVAGHIGQKKIAPFLFDKKGVLDNFCYGRDIKEDIPKYEDTI